jgi:hypothetical protein
MPIFPAEYPNLAALSMPPELGMPEEEGELEYATEAHEPALSMVPVAAPSDPELANLFALMEAGGDEDILTDEETAQLGELLPPDPSTEFDGNLADALEDSELDAIAKQVIERFDWDEESRVDWYEREAEGIRLLGVSANVEGGADFDGAAEVVHPMLMESVLQFQARALSELWPPNGPAKTIVLGTITPEREEQAKRVQDYINYAYTFRMKDAFNVTDKLLFRLPLSGSVFTKLYYCPLRQQVVRKLIKPGDFVVPYHCDDLDEAARYTHVLRLTHHEVKKLMATGFYRKIELNDPVDEDTLTDTTLRDEIDAADSRDSSSYVDDEDQRHVILEQSCYLNLPGFDDPDGLDSPYIVHVEKEQQKVLAIYRNWKDGDPLRNPRRYITHFQFLPGLGFYGYGLYHIMAGLARSSTGALRALLDAAQFANLPGGFRSRDARIKGKDTVVSPGEWKEVEATSEELSKTFFPLPYKEPSPVLFNLLGLMDELGRRLGGATEVLVGDANTNGPVGTTLALIEQGLKVMSGIHMRLHRAQAQELQLFAELTHEYLPPEGYAYAIPGQDQWVMSEDFDPQTVDVVPVSDPNIVSSTQRISLAQAVMDLSNQAPQLYDQREVHLNMLQAMRTQNPERFLPPEQEPPRADPVTENANLLTGKPVMVFEDQDHSAHNTVHATLMQRIPMLDSVGAKGSTKRTELEQGILAHMAEHLAAQVRIDYGNALMQMGMSLPQQEVPPEIENQIAMAAAAAAQTMTPDPGPDPAAVEAAQKAALQEEAVRADIRRKDALSAAELERRNALASSEIARKAAQQEADLLKDFISTNAKLALQAQPKVPEKPMG